MLDLLLLIMEGISATLATYDNLTLGTDVSKFAMAAFTTFLKMPAGAFQVRNEVSELSWHQLH